MSVPRLLLTIMLLSRTPHFSTLAVPTVAAGLSALVLIVQFAIAIARGSYAKDGKAKDSGATHAGLRAYVEALGGMQSAALKVLRVVACLVLLSLSIVSLASSNPATWIDFGLCATYVSLVQSYSASMMPC